MIDKIQHHFGFSQMPFGRDLAPASCTATHAHAEAAARITWAITDIGNQRYQNVLNVRRDTCAA